MAERDERTAAALVVLEESASALVTLEDTVEVHTERQDEAAIAQTIEQTIEV